MTPTRWLILGLVTAVVLFGGGALLGYRAGTSSDATHQAWRERALAAADSLAQLHRAAIADLQAGLAQEAAAREAAERAAAVAGAGARAARATADTLREELAAAASQQDSLALYGELVVALDTALAAATARGDALSEALAAEQRATARLTRMVGLQERMIGKLTEELRAAPQPVRRGIELLGMRVAPCGYAGWGTKGRDVGVGVCVTRAR